MEHHLQEQGIVHTKKAHLELKLSVSLMVKANILVLDFLPSKSEERVKCELSPLICKTQLLD